MNNGLIEREKVISTLRRVFEKYNIGFENGLGGFADEVPKAIKSIPAVYDVDKVVERLEEMRDTITHNISLNSQGENVDEEILNEISHYQKIIKIVKSGGIE